MSEITNEENKTKQSIVVIMWMHYILHAEQKPSQKDLAELGTEEDVNDD